MADYTTVSDIIVPELFNDYLIQKTTELNAFLNSGIATSDPSVNITKGGKTVNIPFFETLSGSAEVLSDTTPLTVHKITTSADIACVHARGIAYASSDLSALFAGADPMKAIAVQQAQVWNNEMTSVIKSTLKGIFGVAALSASINDQSANVLTEDMMADSMFLLGDNYTKITGVAFHSKVLAKLKKLDLVDWVQPSELSLGYYTYMEKRVIVDDTLEAVGGVYPIYFFGNGALAYNENSGLLGVETDRDSLQGVDYLITRRVFTMHPRGVKWIGSPAGETPTNTELETASNWALVENRKNVAVAMLKAKIA